MMMLQLLITTIGVPFFLGVSIAIIALRLPARRGFILALLIPLAAVIIHLMLEGIPSFPPVAAKQKLPIILVVVAVIFATLSLVRRPCSTIFGTILAAVGLALSGWLLGKNVLLGNPAKTVVVLAVFLIVTVAVGSAVALRSADRAGEPSALATALLGVSVAAALTAAFGAFVGMAQINGAFAALTGGWLLIGYGAYLVGDDDALALRGFEGLAFAITASLHLIMTSLFAPKAPPSAIIFTALPFAVAAFIVVAGVSFQRLPRFLRPIVAGAATAVPSIIAIVISAALFRDELLVNLHNVWTNQRRISMKPMVLAATLASTLFAGSAFAVDTYDVDPTHAWVSFKTNHAGWSNAHGIFKTVKGTISFDKSDVANSSISLTIAADSIDTNFEQRNSDLKSPDFLNAEEFPDITFASTKIEKTGDKTAKVTGDLSLAGSVKPVTLDVTWNAESPLPWDAKTVKTGFSATGKFSGLDFGMKKLTDFGLGPDLMLDIDIEAVKK